MFDPEESPTIPDYVRAAIDSVEDAAAIDGKGGAAALRSARREADRVIGVAFGEAVREAYAAGLAAQVTK